MQLRLGGFRLYGQTEAGRERATLLLLTLRPCTIYNTHTCPSIRERERKRERVSEREEDDHSAVSTSSTWHSSWVERQREARFLSLSLSISTVFALRKKIHQTIHSSCCIYNQTRYLVMFDAAAHACGFFWELWGLTFRNPHHVQKLCNLFHQCILYRRSNRFPVLWSI